MSFASYEQKSTELFDVPIGTEDRIIVEPRARRIITATELTVELVNGSAITVRTGQTIRDICNAIEDTTPHDNIDYHFMCIHSEKVYKDLDTTVDEILSDGVTVLIQLSPNP